MTEHINEIVNSPIFEILMRTPIVIFLVGGIYKMITIERGHE